MFLRPKQDINVGLEAYRRVQHASGTNGARAQRAAKRLARAGYRNVMGIGGLEGYRGEIIKD